MGVGEIRPYIIHVAIHMNVSASTQNATSKGIRISCTDRRPCDSFATHLLEDHYGFSDIQARLKHQDPDPRQRE